MDIRQMLASGPASFYFVFPRFLPMPFSFQHVRVNAQAEGFLFLTELPFPRCFDSLPVLLGLNHALRVHHSAVFISGVPVGNVPYFSPHSAGFQVAAIAGVSAHPNRSSSICTFMFAIKQDEAVTLSRAAFKAKKEYFRRF